MNPRSTKFE